MTRVKRNAASFLFVITDIRTQYYISKYFRNMLLDVKLDTVRFRMITIISCS